MDRFVIKTKRKITDEHEQSSPPRPVDEGGISRGHGGTRKKTSKEHGRETSGEHGGKQVCNIEEEQSREHGGKQVWNMEEEQSREHGGKQVRNMEEEQSKEHGGEKHKAHGAATAAEETNVPPQADVLGLLDLLIHSWLH